MGGSTCSGTVTVVDKKDKKKKTVFGYAEVKTSDKGAGPRWINLWKEGERGKTKYDIEPNPHDNSKKYPKKAADFYQSLAEALAGAVMADKDQEFPRRGNVTWQGVTYTLTKD